MLCFMNGAYMTHSCYKEMFGFQAIKSYYTLLALNIHYGLLREACVSSVDVNNITGLIAVTFLTARTCRVSCEQGCITNLSGQPMNLCPVTKGVISQQHRAVM